MKYFLLAGERSGDMHAARLIGQIKKQDVDAEILAWGGNLMEEAGARLLQHYREISYMGLWEVIQNLGTIRRKLKLCEEHLSKQRPDVLILVDFPGFNLRMAKYASSLEIKTCYYISPKIWAWKKNRIHKIKRYVDKMLVILPFEEEFYQRLDYPVTYVGNPLVDSIEEYSYNFSEVNDIRDAQKQKIAFLPGSRIQEVTKAISIINEIADQRPEALFLVAGVDNLPAAVYEKIKERKNVVIKYGQTYELLKMADVAVVTSGTATLEAAVIGTRQVVVYKTSWFTYLIGRILVNIDFISLVNLIAQRKVVEELIQSDYNSKTVLKHVDDLTNDDKQIRQMKMGYEEIRKKLGNKKAAQNAASEIISMLKK